MKLYSLPDDHEALNKKMMADLQRAVRVLFVSPHVQLQTLAILAQANIATIARNVSGDIRHRRRARTASQQPARRPDVV